MRGGILADGMGLGKTLTMITSIVATLDSAAFFAASIHSSDDPTNSPVIPVKSTLVIVPSTCQFPYIFLLLSEGAKSF